MSPTLQKGPTNRMRPPLGYLSTRHLLALCPLRPRPWPLTWACLDLGSLPPPLHIWNPPFEEAFSAQMHECH